MAGHLTHCKKNSNKISLLSYEKVYSEYPIEENSETYSIIYPFETAIEDNLASIETLEINTTYFRSICWILLDVLSTSKQTAPALF